MIMNKKWASVAIIALLIIFIGYIIFDLSVTREAPESSPEPPVVQNNTDRWAVSRIFNPGEGQLNAVAVAENGSILLGGESFITCYDTSLNLVWEFKPEMPVTALTVSGKNVYAAIEAIILIFNLKGEKVGEWGPYEDNSIITSLAANNVYVAFADAANKAVFVLDKKGDLKSLIGRSDDSFIIPSLFFDVAMDSQSNLFVANTGKRRIEKRNIDGSLIDYFGEPGTEPGSFCGCCNPANFALTEGGFVTAEKGINRIKILDEKGEFTEFVSSVNKFIPALPLDVASYGSSIIYGANPADSKLYVFKRK
jgi:hypothetical protein